MDLVTSSVFSPGTGPKRAFPDQLLIVQRQGLLAVADGIGEPALVRAGTRIALDSVRSHIERHEDVLQRFKLHPTGQLRERVLETLREAFGRAAREVFAFARRRPGLVVTLDAALMLRHEAFVGHVGDGRVYLIRRGLVHQLTVDHIRRDSDGVFNSDDTGSGASMRGLRIALGPEPTVAVETMCMELRRRDRLVVSTASLHHHVSESALHLHLANESLDKLTPALARSAQKAPIVAAAAQFGSGAPAKSSSAQRRLAILAPIQLFKHCTEQELRVVAAATHPRVYPEGAVIFKQGDPGTELFLIIMGAVRIEQDGHEIVTLKPGSSFGEMAMLDEPQRSASAIASTKSELMVIPRDAFFTLLRDNRKLAVKILWNMLLRLSKNLRETSARLAGYTEPEQELDIEDADTDESTRVFFRPRTLDG